MEFTKTELQLLNFILQTKEDNKTPKTYGFTELEIAMSIFSKIKENIKEDKFIDGELELTTEEKSLLLKQINREFSISDGETAIKVKEKLS